MFRVFQAVLILFWVGFFAGLSIDLTSGISENNQTFLGMNWRGTGTAMYLVQALEVLGIGVGAARGAVVGLAAVQMVIAGLFLFSSLMLVFGGEREMEDGRLFLQGAGVLVIVGSGALVLVAAASGDASMAFWPLVILPGIILTVLLLRPVKPKIEVELEREPSIAQKADYARVEAELIELSSRRQPR